MPGSEAGMVLHHLSNSIGAPTENEWALIVMRAWSIAPERFWATSSNGFPSSAPARMTTS